MQIGLCIFILGGSYQISDRLGAWTANLLIKGFITCFGIGLSSINQVVPESLSSCTKVFPSLHTCTRTHMLAPVGESNTITSCAGSGDSHRMPLWCLKAVDSEARHCFFSSNYLIQERWRISRPNYRLSFLKLFERWSFNWLHCFCSVLFSLFTTISRLKLNLTGTKTFLFRVRQKRHRAVLSRASEMWCVEALYWPGKK